jgi:hypothetical protein
MVAPSAMIADSILRYHLIPGDPACSSWSLRGWLLLEALAIESAHEVAPRTPAVRRSHTAPATRVF